MRSERRDGRQASAAVVAIGAVAVALGGCQFSFHIGDMHDASAPAASVPLAGALRTPERQAADAFLAALTSQGPSAAYAKGASRLHADLTAEGWVAYALRERFADARGVSWAAQGRQGALTALAGALTFPDGRAQPLRVVMAYESEAWKVAAITEATPAFAAPVPAPTVGGLGGSPPPGPGRGFTAAEVGDHCLTTLRSRLPLDSLTCPAGLPLAAGVSETCIARSGAVTGLVVATSTGMEANGRAGLDCHAHIEFPDPDRTIGVGDGV